MRERHLWVLSGNERTLDSQRIEKTTSTSRIRNKISGLFSFPFFRPILPPGPVGFLLGYFFTVCNRGPYLLLGRDTGHDQEITELNF